ncbi:MAG: hypothetical protein IJE16_00400 [Ruminococcus sp.]|nr:hypothetical protein [Ruminococcus sp.]
MKVIKRTIALCLILISVMSVFCVSANAAGNIQDTVINISAVNNDGGTPRMSIWRAKRDATSVWCENKSTSGGSLSAWVHRTNDTRTTSVYTVDSYYGTWSYNGATRNMKTLPKGTYYYLPNYVYEHNYSYATLGYIMNKESVAYSIAWSPDSV